MYSTELLYDFACKYVNNYIPLCGNVNADDFTVLQVPFKALLIKKVQNLQVQMSRSDVFIFCFWLTLAFTSYGLVEAVMEFVRVYSIESYDPMTFWFRTYKHISLKHRRQARIFGSASNIILDTLAIAGLLIFRSIYLWPWIFTNCAIICLELFYWLSKSLSSKVFIYKPLLSMTFMFTRLALVVHVAIMLAKFTID